MAQTIIDLDAVLGEDKRVRVGGKDYVLPPDLPVELYLRINRVAQGDASELEVVKAMREDILTLFRYQQPELQELPLSLSQLLVVVSHVYGTAGQEVSDARPPRTRGGRSSRSTRKTSSRS